MKRFTGGGPITDVLFSREQWGKFEKKIDKLGFTKSEWEQFKKSDEYKRYLDDLADM